MVNPSFLIYRFSIDNNLSLSDYLFHFIGFIVLFCKIIRSILLDLLFTSCMSYQLLRTSPMWGSNIRRKLAKENAENETRGARPGWPGGMPRLGRMDEPSHHTRCVRQATTTWSWHDWVGPNPFDRVEWQGRTQDLHGGGTQYTAQFCTSSNRP